MSLFSIITSFSKEESDLFIQYIRSRNKRKDTKNIDLYMLLRKGVPVNDIITTLYGSSNRNAYHALSKRLQDSLIDFIATRSFETETSEDMTIFKWILTARILYEQDQIDPAHKLLKKAIKKAKQLDLYTALVEAYHTQIQYSHLHPEQDLPELVAAAQQCHKLFLQQERLNMAYAHIKRTVQFNTALLQQGVQETIEQILADFKIDIQKDLTYKSLYQLLEIINTAAHLDHNFSKALPFITKVYKLIEQKDHVAAKHRFYHIQVLYFMANAHFRVRDFTQAHSYLKLMDEQIGADRRKWESRFRESYLLIHSFVMNYSGSYTTAITSLEEYIKNTKGKSHPDTRLALVVFLTQQGLYKEALGQLNKLKHSDQWYETQLGKDWLIKRDLLTLIIYYELEYVDLAHATLRSFKRKHNSIIRSETRLHSFIAVYTAMHNNPLVIDEDRFRESVKNNFTTSTLKEEDIFMVSFFAWIKSKLDNTPLYDTTLHLL